MVLQKGGGGVGHVPLPKGGLARFLSGAAVLLLPAAALLPLGLVAPQPGVQNTAAAGALQSTLQCTVPSMQSGVSPCRAGAAGWSRAARPGRCRTGRPPSRPPATPPACSPGSASPAQTEILGWRTSLHYSNFLHISLFRDLNLKSFHKLF